MLNRKLDALIEGIADQTNLLNSKADAVIVGIGDQTDLLNRKLDSLIAGSANQTDVLNRKLNALIEGIAGQTDLLNQKNNAIIVGIGHQSELFNRKLDSLIAGSANQTDVLNRKLDALNAGIANQTDLLNRKLDAIITDNSILRHSLNEIIRDLRHRQTRKQYLYYARLEHPNDAVNAENVLEYCSSSGIPAREIIMHSDGAMRSELKQCLSDALAVISTNWNLDHSCIDDRPFLDVAAEVGVPVIQWMLDHPSALWPQFVYTNANNSRFLFESAYSENYFRRFIIPNCQSSWTVGTGPNRSSRIAELTQAAFLMRDFNCVVPMNLRRLSGSYEEIERKRLSLPAHLHRVITDAIEIAYSDLDRPIESHLDFNALPSWLEDPRSFHCCVQIIEDSIQLRRRLKVVEIVAEFPVLLQSDAALFDLPSAPVAVLEQGIGLTETLRRMPRSRAVLSLTHVNDQIHNRILNGLNAGAVNIIEDNRIHRHFFKHCKNALLFRYDDDSLR